MHQPLLGIPPSPLRCSIRCRRRTRTQDRGTLDGVARSCWSSCEACGDVAFQDVDEQRRHFRSEWHWFNVAGKNGVTEEEYEAMNGVRFDGPFVQY